MKMITDSLEKVYTAMGGADTFNKDDIAEGIEQISEVAGGGGSGDSGAMVVIPYDEYTYEDNLYDVAQALWKAGKVPVVQYITAIDAQGNVDTANYLYLLSDPGMGHLYFGGIVNMFSGSILNFWILEAQNSGSVVLTRLNSTMTPVS